MRAAARVTTTCATAGSTRLAWRSWATCRPGTPGLAAMLIYLNRTGYNGLFRLNSSGGFNVPAGRYTDPSICEPDHIRSVAAALGADGVTLECRRFDETIAVARAGDFVCCDPPLRPIEPNRQLCSIHRRTDSAHSISGVYKRRFSPQRAGAHSC